ncbi:MAG: A/G-specific adenine glycosylase [Oscillospiraceae bacterium]|nr:A/G-specific adenine glycosylase [Oscillospiraceae bacterium]
MSNMNSNLKQLTKPLLAWYRQNARDLPWRHTDDPYRIWVSEIMLQQTRVAAVLGYYHRFLSAFPTVYELANAPEQQLMKQWEGLGYYSRARNMQKTALQVVEQYEGVFPETYEELLKLPGVGEYTAGAIASAAFGVAVPAVDGNVLRVVSRICECYDDIADTKVKAAFRRKIEEILPDNREDMRVFNQALMELGATVCVPNGAPKCENCPACDFCRARLSGTVEKLPVKAPKKARRIEEKTVLVLVRDGQIALRKRSDSGLLAGLWEFPNTDSVLNETAVYEYLKSCGLSVLDWKKQLKSKHIFTHVEWRMTGYVLQVSGEGPCDLIWADSESFAQYALPSAFAKFTAEAQQILNLKE